MCKKLNRKTRTEVPLFIPVGNVLDHMSKQEFIALFQDIYPDCTVRVTKKGCIYIDSDDIFAIDNVKADLDHISEADELVKELNGMRKVINQREKTPNGHAEISFITMGLIEQYIDEKCFEKLVSEAYPGFKVDIEGDFVAITGPMDSIVKHRGDIEKLTQPTNLVSHLMSQRAKLRKSKS